MTPDQQPAHPILEHAVAEPIHEEIARYAYAIWEAEGRPDGHDLDDWLEAEAQLRQRHAEG